MFENKEKSAKNFLSLLAVFCLVFAGFDFLTEESIFIPVASFLVVAASFVLLEFYLRIQHNIDNARKMDLSILSLAQKLCSDIERKIEAQGAEFSKNQLSIERKIEAQGAEFSKNQLSIERKIEAQGAEFSKNQLSMERKIEAQGAEFSKNQLSMEKKMDTQLEKLERFYWTYISQKRKDNLLALCPEIFESKSVLYVGARPSRADFLDDFHKNGCGITILEIYPENAEYFKKFPWLEVVEGDVRNFFTDRKFDTIFWWHGPEHIEERDLEMTLKKIESFANKFVVLGCPWGMVPQWKSLEKNPFEEHKAFFDTGYFERLGYKTDYSGVKGRMGSNIISYKRM